MPELRADNEKKSCSKERTGQEHTGEENSGKDCISKENTNKDFQNDNSPSYKPKGNNDEYQQIFDDFPIGLFERLENETKKDKIPNSKEGVGNQDTNPIERKSNDCPSILDIIRNKSFNFPSINQIYLFFRLLIIINVIKLILFILESDENLKKNHI